MAEKTTEAKAKAGHEIMRHLRLFSRLRLKEMGGVIGETFSEWNNDNAQ